MDHEPDQQPPVPSEPPSGGVPLEFDDIINELKTQLSDLNYQNTLLRLTIKQMQR
jgi:hypothetical protein